jgi:hypothetical protein
VSHDAADHGNHPRLEDFGLRVEANQRLRLHGGLTIPDNAFRGRNSIRPGLWVAQRLPFLDEFSRESKGHEGSGNSKQDRGGWVSLPFQVRYCRPSLVTRKLYQTYYLPRKVNLSASIGK